MEDNKIIYVCDECDSFVLADLGYCTLHPNATLSSLLIRNDYEIDKEITENEGITFTP